MRRDLTRRLRECIEGWRREWADERSPEFRLELREARAYDAAGDWRSAMRFHFGVEGTSLTFIVPSRMTPWIAGMRADYPRDGFENHRPQNQPTIAATIEMEGITVLASRIFESAGMQRASPERSVAIAPMHEFGAARRLHVSVWLKQCADPFVLSISTALACALLPKRPPAMAGPERMERRSAAVGPQDVALEVVLGSAEITVADLAKLAVGDVIVMSAALSEPAELKIHAGERIAAVSVGNCCGRRAVQIKNESRRGKS